MPPCCRVCQSIPQLRMCGSLIGVSLQCGGCEVRVPVRHELESKPNASVEQLGRTVAGRDSPKAVGAGMQKGD